MFTNSQNGMKFKRPLPNKPLAPRRPYRYQSVWYRRPWSRTARKSFIAQPEVVELIDGLAETELLHHPDQYHQLEYQDHMAWHQNSSQYDAYGRSSYSRPHGDYNKENAYHKNTRSDHRNGGSELDYYTSRTNSNRYHASSSDRRSPGHYDRDSHHARNPERRYNSRSPPRQRNDYSPYSRERKHFSRSPREQSDSRRGSREEYGKRNSSSTSPGQCYSRSPPHENKRKLGQWSRSRSPSWDRTKSRKTEHRDFSMSPQTTTEEKRHRNNSSSNSADRSEKEKKKKYFNKHKQKHKKMSEENKHSPLSSSRSSERRWNVNWLKFQNGKNPYKWVPPESDIPVGLSPVSSEDLLDNSQRSEEAESDCNGDGNNTVLLERNNKVDDADDASLVLSIEAKSNPRMSQMNKVELEMRRHIIIKGLEKRKKCDEKVDAVSSICSKDSYLKADLQTSEKKVPNTGDDNLAKSNEMKNTSTGAVKGKTDDVEINLDKTDGIFQDKTKESIPATIAVDDLSESNDEMKICNSVSNIDQSKVPHMQLIDTLVQSKEKAPGMKSYIDTLLNSGILNSGKKKKHISRMEDTSSAVSGNSTKTNQSDKLKDKHLKRNRNLSRNETNCKMVISDNSSPGVANTSEATNHTKVKLMIDSQIIHDKSNIRKERKASSDEHYESCMMNDSEYKSCDTIKKRTTSHISVEVDNQDSRKHTMFSYEKFGKQEALPCKTTDGPANFTNEKKRFRKECEIKQNKGESVPSKYEKVKQNDHVESMKSDIVAYNNKKSEVGKSHKKHVSSTLMNENIRGNKCLSGNKNENTDIGEHSMPKGNTTPDSVRQTDKPVFTRSPSVVEGKVCRPSFGEYIPLGKSHEKKRHTVSAREGETASKCKLFGKNQKRISHLAQKHSDRKKCSSPLKTRKELKSGKIVKHAFKHTAVRNKKLITKKIGKEFVSRISSKISKEKKQLVKNDFERSNKQVRKEERLSQDTGIKKFDSMKADEKILSDLVNDSTEELRQSQFIHTPTNQYKDDNNQTEKVNFEQKKEKGSVESYKGEIEKKRKHSQIVSAVSKLNKEKLWKEKVTEDKVTNEMTSEISSGTQNKFSTSNYLDTEEPKESADTIERKSVPSESKPESTSSELNADCTEDNHLDSCIFDEEDIEPIEMIGSVFTNERDLDAEEHEQNDFIERKQSENENIFSANFNSDDVGTKVKFCDDILVIKGAEKKDVKNNDFHNPDKTLAEISENNECRTVNKTPRKKFAATLSGLGKILHEQTKSKALPIFKVKKREENSEPAKIDEISGKNEESDNESDKELLSIGIELTPSKQSSDCKEWLQKAKSKAIKIPSNLKSIRGVKDIKQKENPDSAISDTDNDVLIRTDGNQVPSLGEVCSEYGSVSSIDNLAKRVQDGSCVNGKSGNNTVSNNRRSPVREPDLSPMHAEVDVTGNTPITGEHSVGNGTVLNTEKDMFVGDKSNESMNTSTDSYTKSDSESEVPILSNDLWKKVDMSALKNRIEVVHTKYLTNGITVQTSAYLCPEKFYKATLSEEMERSKCLCCLSCSMLFSPLNFTLHHDTGNIVALIDPVLSKRSEYRLAERPSKDVANIFKLFIQYFHFEREQGFSMTRLPQAKSSTSEEKSIPTVSKLSPQINDLEMVNKVSTVGCHVSEEVQPQEDVSHDRVSKAESENSQQQKLQDSVVNIGEIPTSDGNESAPPNESIPKSSSTVERRRRLFRSKSGSSQLASNGAIMYNSLTLPLISGSVPSDLQFSMDNSSATIYSQQMINSQTQNGYQNTSCLPYAVNSQGSSPNRNVLPNPSKTTLLSSVLKGNSYDSPYINNAAKPSLQRSEPNSLQMRTVGVPYIMGNAQHPCNEPPPFQTGTSQQSCNVGNKPLDFQEQHEKHIKTLPQGYVAGNTPIVFGMRYMPVLSQTGAVSQVIGTVPHGHQRVNSHSTNHDRSITPSSQRILITQPHQIGNVQLVSADSHTPVYQISNPSVTPPQSNCIINSPVVTTSDKQLLNQSQVSTLICSPPSSTPTFKTLPVKSAFTSPETLNTTSGQVLNRQNIGQSTHDRPETSASCQSGIQHMVGAEASISNDQTTKFSHKGLMAEVNVEERKRELLEELCMLENIKTSDRGLDILLLSNLLKVRGLSTVNKDVLKLSREKMKHLIEPVEKRPLTEEERIQNIVDLKKTVSQAR